MRGLLLFGIGVLVGMELAKRMPATSQTIPPTPQPFPEIKPEMTEYQRPRSVGQTARFYPSYLTGARPEHPYQVRWGSGNQYLDTTKKAQMVL